MKKLRLFVFLAGLVILLSLITPPASAQIFAVNIRFDENCNGTIAAVGIPGSSPLPCFFLPDPGPGGLANVMFYSLLGPPNLVAGDVLVTEPGSAGLLSDLLRFDPNVLGGGIFVYSDIGTDALADIGFPTSFNINNITLPEVGPECCNGLVYTPGAGQPGEVPGFAVTYTFISDTPEPATALLLAAPLVVLALRRRKKLTT